MVNIDAEKHESVFSFVRYQRAIGFPVGWIGIIMFAMRMQSNRDAW